MLAEFRAFILRGNVLDLAVAVVLGVAFNNVVTTFTDGILMAAIAGIFGEPDFSAVTIGVGQAQLQVGLFANTLVNLLLVGASLFLIVKAVGHLRARGREDEVPAEEAPPAPSDEARLLAEIRDLIASEAGGAR